MTALYSIPKLEWYQNGPAGNRWADSAFGRIYIHRSIVHGLFVSFPRNSVGCSPYMADTADAEAWAQEKYESELAGFLVRTETASA